MAMNSYLKALGIGMVAGSRSMTAPALLSAHLAGRAPDALEGTLLSPFTSSWATMLARVAAVGEMVADKTPNIPPRTEALPLMGRLTVGAFSGFVLCMAERESALLGALFGAIGALVGTFGFYHLRRLIGEETSIPDFAIAVAEDAVAVGGGLAVLEG